MVPGLQYNQWAGPIDSTNGSPKRGQCACLLPTYLGICASPSTRHPEEQSNHAVICHPHQSQWAAYPANPGCKHVTHMRHQFIICGGNSRSPILKRLAKIILLTIGGCSSLLLLQCGGVCAGYREPQHAGSAPWVFEHTSLTKTGARPD